MKAFFFAPRFLVLWIALVLPAGLWAQGYSVTFSKAFSPASIPLGGTTTLSFTLTGADQGGAFLVSFTDNLPTGLVISSSSLVSNTCSTDTFGATITADTVANTVNFSGADFLYGDSCTFSVNVTGAVAGVYNNTAGPLICADCFSGGNTASASLTVVGPPTIGKSFGAASIPVNGSTTLSFTIANPNTSASLSGIAFSDPLPGGLAVSASPGLTSTCVGGSITATGGSGSVSLTGLTLAASASCTFSVNVTGSTAGTKSNTTGAISSTEGGTGGTATASLAVLGPPTIGKSFGAAGILVYGSTSLSFTITNPNAGASLSGIAFTDPLPGGLAVATPNGLAGSCGGGSITATGGSSSVSLTGATLAASASCTFSVSVTSTTAGTKSNTTGAVSSNEGGAGGTASASLVVQLPTIPVLSPWALAGLALLLAGLGWVLASLQGQRSRPNV